MGVDILVVDVGRRSRTWLREGYALCWLDILGVLETRCAVNESDDVLDLMLSRT